MGTKTFSTEKYPYQSDSYTIIGLCMEIHNTLGKGLAEIVYKDALEIELRSNQIYYQREKKYDVVYKGIILRHHFYADFVIENKIILEIKCKKNILDEHYAAVINYLAISKCSRIWLGNTLKSPT